MSRSYIPPKPTQPAVDPKPPGRGKRGAGGRFILLVVTLAVAVTAAVVIVIMNRSPGESAARTQTAAPANTTTAPAATTTAATRGIANVQPATPQPVSVTPELTAELQSVCTRFAATLKSGDRTDIALWVDARRALEEMRRFATVFDSRRRGDLLLAPELGTAVVEALASNPGLRLTRALVRKIQPLDTPGEVIVFVRAWNATAQMKFRWWFKKTGSVWRLYDLEELDSGVRAYHAMAGQIATINGEPPPAWVAGIPPLVRALGALERKDVAAAEKLLADLETVQFPKQLDGTRLALKGLLSGNRGDDAEALRLYDQAAAANADLAVVHRFRATTHNASKRPDLALVSAQKYIDLVGDTAKSCYELGLAHEALGHPAEAAAAYQRGIDDDPASADNRAGLARVRK